MNTEYIDIMLNSDFSENVIYNQPNFPAYIKKDSFHAIQIIVPSVTGMMILNLY